MDGDLVADLDRLGFDPLVTDASGPAADASIGASIDADSASPLAPLRPVRPIRCT